VYITCTAVTIIEGTAGDTGDVPAGSDSSFKSVLVPDQ
jgi:hypothetical protein